MLQILIFAFSVELSICFRDLASPLFRWSVTFTTTTSSLIPNSKKKMQDTSDSFFRRFANITCQDLRSEFRELGYAIRLFMYGVILWVRDGVATIPTTLSIRSYYIELMDQCVTSTPSIEVRGKLSFATSTSIFVLRSLLNFCSSAIRVLRHRRE